MQIRDNVRERRRERIQQIIGQQSNENTVDSHHKAGIVNRLETDSSDVKDLEYKAAPTTRIVSPPPISTSDDPDPELWWKEREKRVKENRGSWQGLKGLPPTSQIPKAPPEHSINFSQFLRGFTWRVVCAFLLFAAFWGWFKLELPGSDEAHKWMVSSVTRDMDFETIEAWYGETFGGSPSFFPFNQDNPNTEAVTARLSPEETKAPVEGTIIESFAQSGTGMKIAAKGGSDIVSIFTGRVQQVTQEQDGGITILVQHPNDILTVYGSLENAAVKPNDWVKTGQLLGQLDVSEDKDAVLYFAVQENGKTLDPADVVSFD